VQLSLHERSDQAGKWCSLALNIALHQLACIHRQLNVLPHVQRRCTASCELANMRYRLLLQHICSSLERTHARYSCSPHVHLFATTHQRDVCTHATPYTAADGIRLRERMVEIYTVRVQVHICELHLSTLVTHRACIHSSVDDPSLACFCSWCCVSVALGAA
jgi:hypothetical protein